LPDYENPAEAGFFMAQAWSSHSYIAVGGSFIFKHFAIDMTLLLTM